MKSSKPYLFIITFLQHCKYYSFNLKNYFRAANLRLRVLDWPYLITILFA